MKATLNPYLKFMGQTKAAMEFYTSVFGGNLTIQTYKDAGMSKDPKDDNNVIHSMLQTDSFTFMAADGDEQHPVSMGDNISMSIMGSDEAQLRGYFEKLSEGGKVDLPLAKQFWGDIFGEVTDKFGVSWMVNITSKEPKA